jgi:murein DD-endopeptidase MepM/ murein hydrolase activator NlpD
VTPSLALPLGGPAARIHVLQAFGENTEAYARFGLKGHNGLDFAGEAGEPILAVDDGELVEVRFDADGYGLTVKLLHAWGESRYAHGQRYSVPVDFYVGHQVRRGDRVLQANGSHVHFAIRLRQPDGSLDLTNANGFAGWDDPLPLLQPALGLPAPAPTPAAVKARKG